jgi:hypothetical protein
MYAEAPNQVLHFDFMHIEAPPADNLAAPQYVLVLLDGFSKFVELVPCTNADSETAVVAILDWIKRFGVVTQWVSDQGTHFLNDLMAKLAHRLQARHHFTVAYAPWSNGQVERVNREIRELLSGLLLEWKLPHTAWPQVLPLVNYVLNNTPSKNLGGFAPVTVFTGHPPRSPLDVVFLPSERELRFVPLTDVEFLKKVEDLQSSLATLHHAVLEKKKRKKIPRPGEVEVDFGVGDYVLVSSRATSKLAPKWEGPAVVVAKVNDRRFVVKNLVTDTEREWHAECIKRYCDHDLKITDQLKAFVAYSGRGYVVDSIADHRWNSVENHWEFEVIWEGYPRSESTWEPWSALAEDAPLRLRSYVTSLDDPELKDELLELLSGRKKRRVVGRRKKA